MQKTQLKYINVAKGFGIFLVIWGHLLPSGFLNNLIYSFHMPAFLFLSGYMLKKRDVELTLHFLQKRVKQLIVPYLLFSAAYLIWELLINKESLIGMIYLTYQTVTCRGMAPLWFLPSLFFSEILFLWLKKKSKKTLIFFLVLLCVGHVAFGQKVRLSDLSGFISQPLLFLLRTSLCFIFLAAGYSFCRILKSCRTELKNRKSALVCAFCLFAVCAFTVAITELDVNLHLYEFSSIGLFLIIGILGAAATLTLSAGIGKSRVIEAVGKKSLVLMALHYPLTQIIKNYIPDNNWAMAILLSLTTAIVLILVLMSLSQVFKSTILKRKKHEVKE